MRLPNGSPGNAGHIGRSHKLPDLETSKKDSSQRQIQAAIAQYEVGALDCAITLAAAAEGILPATDDPHLFQILRDHPELEPNLVINWLKHANGPQTATITKGEAALTIARAISKFVAVYHQSTNGFQGFLRAEYEAGNLPVLL